MHATTSLQAGDPGASAYDDARRPAARNGTIPVTYGHRPQEPAAGISA
jgi:hypothetical protein